MHGAARDTLAFAKEVTGRELASAIDNPMVLPDGRVESCGNFHGAPIGLVADYLAIALAEVGAIAERRVDRLLDHNRSQGLPPFLADDPGVDSGLMIGQYTAAAMCAENRRLAAPASVDSYPTSAMQEDHVSMGWSAARKLRVGGRQSAPDTGHRVGYGGAVDRPAGAARTGGRHRGRDPAPETPRARSGPRSHLVARTPGSRGASSRKRLWWRQ